MDKDVGIEGESLASEGFGIFMIVWSSITVLWALGNLIQNKKVSQSTELEDVNYCVVDHHEEID